VRQDEALLQTILAEPQEDAPRLVFADWLDDNGQPERAEFIRLQIEVATGSVPPRRRAELYRRQDDLLRAHELAWVGPLADLVQRARFVRGFVERVTVTAEGFLQDGPQLFDLAPVRHVILTDHDEHLPRLVKSPLLECLATLELRTGPDTQGVRLLAASKRLANLTGLVLQSSGIEDEGAELLAQSPHLKRLTMLDLYESPLEVRGIRALARSSNLAGLMTLVLGGACQDDGDAWVSALVETPAHLERLNYLHLSFNLIGDAGARALARAPQLATLTTLDLTQNQIGAKGARALAESTHLSGLKSLNLRGNPLDEKAQSALRGRFGKGVQF
jgi:uncharacterized protein (TIGR02996 family)